MNEPQQSPAPEPIAIIGMGCRFPGAASPAAFWQLLDTGQDAVTEVPAERWDIDAWYDPDPNARGKMYTRWGGFLEGLDQFDAAFFGISPREAAHLDPRQRLMLELAWEALEDAGIPANRLAGSRTGVFVATLSDDYGTRLFDDLSRIEAYSGTGNAHSVVANRLSYTFGLHGPSLAVDTACSGSLVALHLACQSLRSGESELALVGGVNVILEPDTSVFFSRAGALAPDGRCKTFDARANGIVRSEGAGLLVLKPLSRAQADGDTIHALVLGSAVNQDGRTNGIMAPSRPAQEALLRTAYQGAGVLPGAVQYIEAHGTGTPLGDPIEAQALGAVLAEGRATGQPCLLGSVKTNIGHTEAAAGVAGVIKVALALKHRRLPRNLHYTAPNPLIPFDTLPLRVVEQDCSWPDPDAQLIAGVSSFGFGGTNAHVVLAEAPAAVVPEAPAGPSPDALLLPLSARGEPALLVQAQRFAALLRSGAAAADVCAAAATRRSHLEQRLALVGTGPDALAEQLEAFASGAEPAGVLHGTARVGGSGRLVWAFSGQGTHWVGMGRAVLAAGPVAREALHACDQALQSLVDWSLLEVLTAPDAQALLAQTAVAQPAIVAMQIALAAQWRAWGLVPDAIVGQSLGEVAAAHVAGALSLEDALRVVVARSRLMQTVAGQGKTAAVGLPFEEAELLLMMYDDLLAVAGSSSPNASVISGDPALLERVLGSLGQQGVFCRLLNGVDVAFHSPQMAPLQPLLEQELAGVAPRPTTVPLYSTVAAARIDGAQLDAAYWGRNLREPFRFAAVMAQLLEAGFDTVLEISPHAVLTGPVQECATQATATVLALPSLRRDDPGCATLLASLAQLYVQGASIDWTGLYPGCGAGVVLPSYPWQREHYWMDQLASGTGAAAGERRAAGHPLLGLYTQVASAPEQHLWELDLNAQTLHYLDEHRVYGRVVLPGAAFVEMALGAAQALNPAAVQLDTIAFEQALVLSDEHSSRVQLAVTPLFDHRASFAIYSRTGPALPWTRHATGTLAFGPHSAPPARLIEQIQARCPTAVAGEAHYQAMQQHGLAYGPSFQGVTAFWRGAGEALARLALPQPLVAEQKSYCIHPALLDAALQTIAAAVAPEAETGQGYLPVGIGGLRLLERPAAQVWCHTTLRSEQQADPATRTADMVLLDDGGQVLAEINGLLVRRVDQRQAAVSRVEDWLYRVEWQPQERGEAIAQAAGRTAGVWLIFRDQGTVGEGLAELLGGCGEASVVVGAASETCLGGDAAHLSIRPDDPGSYRQLLETVQQRYGHIQGVVHLWSLDAPCAECTADLEQAQSLGSLSVTFLTQALLASGLGPKLWLATRGAQLVGEGQSALAIEQAPLWGLGRVLGQQEQLALWGGLVDLDPAPGAQNAALLFEEVLASDGDDQIAFRNGLRYTARLVRAELPQRRPARLRADASYLITGGMGALGLLIARWMVEQGARRLVLLGRTPLPPRREWAQAEPGSAMAHRIAAVRSLEALGASVLVAPVDVASADALAAFLVEYAQEGWPPIRGVVYAAGVVRDQLFPQIDPASFWQIMRPKLHGAWLLDRLLDGQPLDFFTIFGSAAALIGLPGQAVYAAANAFLDALAQRAAAAGRPLVSIGWGPWSAGMEDALGLASFHAQRGMHALATEQALALAGALMRQGPPQIAVCAADWARVCESYPLGRAPALVAHLARERLADGPASPAGGVLAELLAASPDAQPALVEAHIQALIARVMRMDVARIDPRQPLNSLGIDSMMATELKNSIALSIGANLPVVDLLQGVSVVQISQTCLAQLQTRIQAERLAALAAAGGPVSAEDFEAVTAAVDADELERLLHEIDQLSDDEIASVLSAQA